MIRWYIKRLIIVTAIVAIVVSARIFFKNHGTVELIKEELVWMQRMVDQQYVRSVLLFLALFIATAIATVPITALLTVLAGFLFGVIPGTLYAVIGSAMSGIIIVVSVRYLFGQAAQARYAQQLQKLNRELEHYGIYYLLVVQIMPMTPVFFIHLLVGVTEIPLWTYLWTFTLGIIPGTLLYAIAGREFHTITSLRDIFSWPLLIALMLFALIILVPVLFLRNSRR
jgi:uncharacterized membrane protein YdjX (TVP38/TMEM64 family)